MLLYACRPKELTPKLWSGKVEVLVLHHEKPKADIEVKLYRFLKDTLTISTDHNGIAHFQNLVSEVYYIKIDDPCINTFNTRSHNAFIQVEPNIDTTYRHIAYVTEKCILKVINQKNHDALVVTFSAYKLEDPRTWVRGVNSFEVETNPQRSTPTIIHNVPQGKYFVFVLDKSTAEYTMKYDSLDMNQVCGDTVVYIVK